MAEEINWSGRLLPNNRPEAKQCDCGAPAVYGREDLGPTTSEQGRMRWFCLSCWVMMGYWRMP